MQFFLMNKFVYVFSDSGEPSSVCVGVDDTLEYFYSVNDTEDLCDNCRNSAGHQSACSEDYVANAQFRVSHNKMVNSVCAEEYSHKSAEHLRGTRFRLDVWRNGSTAVGAKELFGLDVSSARAADRRSLGISVVLRRAAVCAECGVGLDTAAADCAVIGALTYRTAAILAKACAVRYISSAIFTKHIENLFLLIIRTCSRHCTFLTYFYLSSLK